MPEFIEIPGGSQLGNGQMKMFSVGGKEILLARVGDTFYAADNRCAHMGGHLSEGKLEGTVVTCPRHHSQYDLSDGRVIRWTDWTGIKLSLAKLFRPPRPIKTYKVKVEDGKAKVELEAVPAGTAAS
jgi:3-phenylpropionate/trans-cinnamate dioxygenase ferredoxin subunit